MKSRQALLIAGGIFQIGILSLTLYFLHGVNQKNEDPFQIEAPDLALEEVLPPKKEESVPFQHYVKGNGRVACSNYMKINARREGIVGAIFAKEGDLVHVGEPLFQIDEGMLSYLLEEKKAEHETAIAEMKFFEKTPDDDEKNVFKAVAKEKEIAVKSFEKAISDCKVNSPFEGRVLKVYINEGEFIKPSEDAFLIGSDHPLHLHVVVDEKEIWRISPTKTLRAMAFHRTNPNIHFILNFVAIKHACDKENVSGMIEMVFAFDKGKAPIYLDQTLDVYIEAASPNDKSFLEYQFHQTQLN